MNRDALMELNVPQKMIQDCPFSFKSLVIRYAGVLSHVQSLKGGVYWTTIGFEVWHGSSGTRLVTCDFPTNSVGEMEDVSWFYLFEINGSYFKVFVRAHNRDERCVTIEITEPE